MERDSRRDQGEWRGCHNFDRIICDGDSPTERRGGLKMGETYYYYYEINGSTETYNHSLPTTNNCPFLPGQTVNKLDVPMERRLRLKSASMNSLRNTDYQTMDPVDRFTSPKPPCLHGRRDKRSPTAYSTHKQASPLSSSPSGWSNTARRFLGLKHRDAERGRKPAQTEVSIVSEEHDTTDESRSVTPSGSVRSRDLSPESLKRFLSDDQPSASADDAKPESSSITEDGEDSDNDDDDNFATAVMESAGFTNLSPPPFQRGGLSAPPASHLQSTAVSSLTLGINQFSFYDDSGDEDEHSAPRNIRRHPSKLQMASPITGYSLPQSPTTNKAFELQSHFATFGIDCQEP